MFAQPSYQAYRWKMFVDQLGARFPDIHFIATSYPSLALDPAYVYSTWPLFPLFST
jgi:alpha-L-arabinofuranosidase